VSAGQQNGTLYIFIPINVRSQNSGDRVRVLTAIELKFSIQGTPVQTINVSCWEDNLADCAGQILPAVRAVGDLNPK
jgi:hypothetical protein